MRKLLLILACLLHIGLAAQPARAATLDARYQAIRADYAALRANPAARAERANWIDIAARLSALIGDESATRPRLDARMRYTLGMVYFGMYGQFRLVEDLQKAHDTLNDLVLKYPANPLADDALFFRGEILHKLGDDNASSRVLRSVLVTYPGGNRTADARRLLNKVERHRREVARAEAADGEGAPGGAESGRPAAGDARTGTGSEPGTAPGDVPPYPTGTPVLRSPAVALSSVKVWTNPDYTRVVLEVADKVAYRHRLEQDDGQSVSHVVIDLSGVVLDDNFEKTLLAGEERLLVPVSGGLLHTLSVAQSDTGTIELDLEVGPLRTYRVTPFQAPFRILVDLFGRIEAPDDRDDLETLVLNLDGRSGGSTDGGGDRTSPSRFVVVLDAGHGGKDTGAIGPGGTMEKDVVLAIARQARDKLEALPGVSVVMVRDRDVFVPLDERTRVANRKNADLFISIHANALANRRASGIETYYLDTASDEGAARLAAKENATLKDHSLLGMIVQDLTISGNVRYSRRLARTVHRELVEGVRRHYPPHTVRDLGVKSALFYVLFGAQMPSILVEVSFISNPVEEIRLGSRRYQEVAAEAICEGVLRYWRETATLSRAGGM